MRRNSMQVSILAILDKHGLRDAFDKALDTNTEFHARLEKPNYDPLVIEVIGGRITVTHYYEHNGDLIPDPELVYKPAMGIWYPVELTQGPMGVYRPKFFERDGRTMVDLGFDNAVRPLEQLWARNLKFQNWDRATVTL